MGCVSSKSDINDINPNIFQVINVNELGNQISPGQLEITESDLVFHQRKRPHVRWPLRSLRRYGYDSEIFSFECGRRCPTGPGIYAFRCSRAERLFEHLQSHIQVRNFSTSSGDGSDTVSRDFPLSGMAAIRTNSDQQVEGNYLEPASDPLRTTTVRGGIQRIGSPKRLSSVGSSSNGPLSPQGTASPSPPPTGTGSLQPLNISVANSASTLQSNRTSHINDSLPSTSAPITSSTRSNSYQNGELLLENNNTKSDQIREQVNQTYINIDIANLDASITPVYMNILTGQTDELAANIQGGSNVEWEDPKHCYANLDTRELNQGQALNRVTLSNSFSLRNIPIASNTGQRNISTSLAPTSPETQVNYIVLDLDNKNDSVGTSGFIPPSSKSTLPPSPTYNTSSTSAFSTISITSNIVSAGGNVEGYATIDFGRTVALSQSTVPRTSPDEEGSRRTRHNSTITNSNYSE